MSHPTWNPDLEAEALALMNAALVRDLGERGDVTSDAVLAPDARGRGRVVARAAGVVAGMQGAAPFFEEGGLVAEPRCADGEAVARGQVLLLLRGPLSELLARERTALNLLGHLGGIATLAARFVEAVEGHACRVLDTRKTVPGLRHLAKYAVRCGGASNHRIGLHDMVLLKENHIAAAGGIGAAVEAARAHVPDLAIEVEVRNLEELREALPLGVERIMLDNFDLELLRDAVALTAGGVPLEASGGIDLCTVGGVAATGVDFVSVGSLTHSAPALDLSLLLDPVD